MVIKCNKNFLRENGIILFFLLAIVSINIYNYFENKLIQFSQFSIVFALASTIFKNKKTVKYALILCAFIFLILAIKYDIGA